MLVNKDQAGADSAAAVDTKTVDTAPEDTGSTDTKADKPALSSMEQKALDMGWRPLDEFDGDPDDFIDAKEFVRRKPLFEKIEHQSKELKAVRVALENLKNHQTKVSEVAYQRAVKDLKEKQKQALVDGDVDSFYAVEEQREALEKEKQEVVKANQALTVEVPAVNPVLDRWLDRNRWYEQKPHMRLFAEDVAMSYKGRMEPEKILEKVEQAVKEEFPQHFRNKNKESVSSVEEASTRRTAGSSSGGNSNSLSSFERTLNEQEKRVMANFVRAGVMTKEQYLKDLQAIKGE